MTALPRLLAITPPTGRVGLGCIEAAVDTGAPLGVLLREPGASPAALLDADGRLGALRLAAQAAGIPVWLSCDAAAVSPVARRARDAGLRGLQLRGDPDPTAAAAARLHWPQGVFGRSVHGVPRAGGRWDYSVFAPVFSPRTASRHPKAAAGTAALQAWCDVEPGVFALGGVTPESATACLAAGAWGLAGISMFSGPAQAVADTLRALTAALPPAPGCGPAPEGAL